MFLIQEVTSDARQLQTLVLDDGTSLTLSLYYIPMQLGWFITDLVYQDFEIQSLRITVSPNMLYQFKNQLPFGLGCFTNQGREPTQQEDFSSGNFQLYILSQAEVEQYSEFLSNG